MPLMLGCVLLLNLLTDREDGLLRSIYCMSCSILHTLRLRPHSMGGSHRSDTWCGAVLVAAVLLLVCCGASSAESVTDEVDTYYCVVTLQAGTTSFNATQSYSTATLTTLSNDICALITPLLPTNTANSSYGCFVSYELSPVLQIHVPLATRGVSASYAAYNVLTSWTSASAFTPLANIRQRIFVAFNVSSSSTTFVNATTTIPCRSQYTRPGATPAPTLAPLVCVYNTSIVPVYQDLIFLTSSALVSSSLSTALCDVLGTTRCAMVSATSLNVQNTDYNLLSSTVRIAATQSGKLAIVLALVDSVRRSLYPTLSALSVQRILLVPPPGTVGNTTAYVSLYDPDENTSPDSPPPVMVCNKFYSYWAFILLIFAPMFYIAFRQSYHAGRKKGIKLERQHMKEEEELREAEEQQREQQHLQMQGYHRSASQQHGASGSQHDGGIDGSAGYPPQTAPPDPSQWDPAMVAYIQNMLLQQQQQQQQHLQQ